MVEFNVKTNNSEFKDYIYSENEAKYKKILNIIFFMFTISGVLMFLISWLDYSDGLNDDAVIDLISGVFLILLAFLSRIFVKRLMKKAQKQEIESNILFKDNFEFVYKFDEEKIYIFSSLTDEFNSAIECKYNYINAVSVYETHYILYVSKIQCYVLPKSSLVSGTLEEFESYLNKNINQLNIKRMSYGG